MNLASILVVADKAIAPDLETDLKVMGYIVAGVVGSGEEAVQLARRQRPSLTLMRAVLDGPMDGIETAKYLSRGQGIPVIFLTSINDSETARRAALIGPYGYLTTPLKPREVHNAIEVALCKAGLERQSRESEHWFASTLRCVGDGIICTDPDGQVRFLNLTAEELIGYTLVETRGRRLEEVVRIVDAMGSNIAEIPVKQALSENRVVGIDYGQRLRRRDGTDVPVDLSAAPLRREEGGLAGAVLVLRDVRSRRHHEQQLRASAQHFRDTFESFPLGMALVGMDGRFMQVNEAICRFLGFEAHDLLAMSDDALTSPPDRGLVHACFNDLLSGKTPVVQFEKRYLHRDGSRALRALVNVSLIREDEAPLCYLYQIHDLTAHQVTEVELSRLAYFDPLSGLANRSRLRDRMDSMIANAHRQRTQFAVVFMDLDRFKEINEKLGQEACDSLLKQVANRLTAVLRETDCAARLADDEFVLLLSEVRTKESVHVAVEKIRAAVSQPIEIANQTFVTTPNFGISLYPSDGENPRDLLRCAESALYAAKVDGLRSMAFLANAEGR